MLPTLGIPVQPAYAAELRARIKSLAGCKSDGFPGATASHLTPPHLKMLETTDYFVCERGWGTRVLILLMSNPDGPAAFVLDKDGGLYYNEMCFPQANNIQAFLHDTIMDGEMIRVQSQSRFIAHDLISFNGTSVTLRSLNTRLGILQQDIIKPHKQYLQRFPDLLANVPFSVGIRKHERSYGLGIILSNISRERLPSTGLIFTPVRASYIPGEDTQESKLLKWIFPEAHRINFLVRVVFDKERKPHYYLYINDRNTPKYFDDLSLQTRVAQAWKASPPDGKIIECSYDSNWKTLLWENGYAGGVRIGGWQFVRFREDKRVADDELKLKETLEAMKHGITREMLDSHVEAMRTQWKAREKKIHPLAHQEPRHADESPVPPPATLPTFPTPSRLDPSYSPKPPDRRESVSSVEGVGNSQSSEVVRRGSHSSALGAAPSLQRTCSNHSLSSRTNTQTTRDRRSSFTSVNSGGGDVFDIAPFSPQQGSLPLQAQDVGPQRGNASMDRSYRHRRRASNGSDQMTTLAGSREGRVGRTSALVDTSLNNSSASPLRTAMSPLSEVPVSQDKVVMDHGGLPQPSSQPLTDIPVAPLTANPTLPQAQSTHTSTPATPTSTTTSTASVSLLSSTQHPHHLHEAARAEAFNLTNRRISPSAMDIEKGKEEGQEEEEEEEEEIIGSGFTPTVPFPAQSLPRSTNGDVIPHESPMTQISDLCEKPENSKCTVTQLNFDLPVKSHTAGVSDRLEPSEASHGVEADPMIRSVKRRKGPEAELELEQHRLLEQSGSSEEAPPLQPHQHDRAELRSTCTGLVHLSDVLSHQGPVRLCMGGGEGLPGQGGVIGGGASAPVAPSSQYRVQSKMPWQRQSISIQPFMPEKSVSESKNMLEEDDDYDESPLSDVGLGRYGHDTAVIETVEDPVEMEQGQQVASGEGDVPGTTTDHMNNSMANKRVWQSEPARMMVGSDHDGATPAGSVAAANGSSLTSVEITVTAGLPASTPVCTSKSGVASTFEEDIPIVDTAPARRNYSWLELVMNEPS
ncbi:hypothetical protein BSLG_009199 [Batrachochytrium salamandrivorans]|nr:hypothetical protein BSLG_009199 [Batrachochytrium salamandrivorans]